MLIGALEILIHVKQMRHTRDRSHGAGMHCSIGSTRGKHANLGTFDEILNA